MTRRLALAAAGLAAAASFATPPAAQACIGWPCDQVNLVCRLALRGECLP